MKKIFFLLLTFAAIPFYAQQADVKSVAFEIKAVAMAVEYPSRVLLSSKNNSTSKLVLNDIRTMNFSHHNNKGPLVYRTHSSFDHQENPIIAIKIPKFPEPTIQVWGRLSNTNNTGSVPNIAYEPALQGNLFDAYCTAIYALRSGN